MISQNSVYDFVNAISEDRRKAYFVLDCVRTENGAFILCMAIEGVAGYYKMGKEWDITLEQAQKLAQDMNNRLGVMEEDADEIIRSSMKPAIFN